MQRKHFGKGNRLVQETFCGRKYFVIETLRDKRSRLWGNVLWENVLWENVFVGKRFVGKRFKEKSFVKKRFFEIVRVCDPVIVFFLYLVNFDCTFFLLSIQWFNQLNDAIM